MARGRRVFPPSKASPGTIAFRQLSGAAADNERAKIRLDDFQLDFCAGESTKPIYRGSYDYNGGGTVVACAISDDALWGIYRSGGGDGTFRLTISGTDPRTFRGTFSPPSTDPGFYKNETERDKQVDGHAQGCRAPTGAHSLAGPPGSCPSGPPEFTASYEPQDRQQILSETPHGSGSNGRAARTTLPPRHVVPKKTRNPGNRAYKITQSGREGQVIKFRSIRVGKRKVTFRVRVEVTRRGGPGVRTPLERRKSPAASRYAIGPNFGTQSSRSARSRTLRRPRFPGRRTPSRVPGHLKDQRYVQPVGRGMAGELPGRRASITTPPTAAPRCTTDSPGTPGLLLLEAEEDRRQVPVDMARCATNRSPPGRPSHARTAKRLAENFQVAPRVATTSSDSGVTTSSCRGRSCEGHGSGPPGM